MNIKPPSFWYRTGEQAPPLAEKAIAPLSRLYLAGHKMRQSKGKREKISIPVLCLGNLNAGGAGKTPAALALMKIIRENELAKNPFFLSRGYGGREKGPMRVDPGIHAARDAGDEPLLLAAQAPAVIARDRAAGAHLAVRRGADMIVMDDGLQNPDLEQDVKIAVIDGEMGFGNGKILPAGPLREPLETGLRKADAFILIGEDRRGTVALLPPDKPLFRAATEAADAAFDKSKEYVAFSGIGHPNKFFALLKARGFKVTKELPYPDHYAYGASDLKKLSSLAQAHDAALITTEKDFVRLKTQDCAGISVLRIALKFEDEKAVEVFLKSRLNQNT